MGGGGNALTQQVLTGHVDWSQVAVGTVVGGAAGGAGAMLSKLAAARSVNAGGTELAGVTSATSRGAAALDTNVLIRGLDNGELDAVDKVLAGRVPNVSPTAVDEYLARGSQARLDQFLAERGGSIGPAGTPEGAAALQAQAASLGRRLGRNDALVAHSAMQQGIPLITGDRQLLRFLVEIGYPAEPF
jgi:predicted nucleic acid-binding protein